MTFFGFFGFRESKISSSEKMRIGGTSEMAWMQICEPTDKEKGHYTIEIHDGKKSHSRTFDLSGQGKWKQDCWILQALNLNIYIYIFFLSLNHLFVMDSFIMCFFILTAYTDAYAEFQRLK